MAASTAKSRNRPREASTAKPASVTDVGASVAAASASPRVAVTADSFRRNGACGARPAGGAPHDQRQRGDRDHAGAGGAEGCPAGEHRARGQEVYPAATQHG